MKPKTRICNHPVDKIIGFFFSNPAEAVGDIQGFVQFGEQALPQPAFERFVLIDIEDCVTPLAVLCQEYGVAVSYLIEDL